MIVLKFTKFFSSTACKPLWGNLLYVVNFRLHYIWWWASVNETKIYNISVSTLLQYCYCNDLWHYSYVIKVPIQLKFIILFTEYLLQKLEYESLYPDKTIPLITSAAEEINIVRDKLLEGNQLEKYSLARILIVVSKYICTIYINAWELR